MAQPTQQLLEQAPAAGLPVPAAQPEHLETIARLRSMDPAPARVARVLEIGCGAGENLLPLADRYPEARFVGINASAQAVESARELAREAGLANVEFRQQDSLDLDAALGTFDYIIAHNLYSRAAEPARDKLLEACRARLADQGIVYLSYETYPGAHVHDMLREMMCYEARRAGNRADALAQARKLLDFLRTTLVQDHPYDALVSAQAAALAQEDDDTLWRDDLAMASRGIYFPQFVEHAQRHGLQWAGDAAVGIRLTDLLWPSAERQLEAISQDDLAREMFRDVLQDRAMRQTLLCHQAVTVSPTIRPEQLAGMYLEGALRPEGVGLDLLSTAAAHFAGPGEVRTTTAWPLVKAALAHLGEAWPDYVRFDELVVAARGHYDSVSPEASTAEDGVRLAENLLHCCLGGSVRLHSQAASFVAQVSETPLASPLARVQARRGGAVGNRRHEGVRLDPFDRQVVELLDGTRNHAQLVEHLASAVGEGRLVALAQERPLTSYDEAKEAFTLALPDALKRLAHAALLIG